MTTSNTERSTWVLAAVKELRKSESWTGRIHIHKLLFILQDLGLAKVPFRFELYQYGPYSFDLDAVIAQLEQDGDLDKAYPKAGYGPSYAVSDEVVHASKNQLKASDNRVLSNAAKALGKQDSNSLELIATCIWVVHREGVGGDSEIIERVSKIKPRYKDTQIRESLETSRQIEASLKPRM